MTHEHRFDYSLFWLPHWHCVANDPAVIAMDAIGNILTALSYMLIPALMLRIIVGIWFFINKSTKALIVHGSVFIFLCGWTHIISTVNWWKTYYGLQSWTVMLTGIVSLWFVGRLFFFIRNRAWEN